MRPDLIATLAVGLPDTSRIMRKYSGIDLTLDQMLLAVIADSLNGLIWGMSKKKGRRPQRLTEKLLKKDKPKDELMTFATIEEYEAFMARKREKWENV